MYVRLRKILVSLPIRIIAVLAGAYLIFGFFLLEPAVKKIIPWIGEKELASRLTLEKIEFNPLTLEVTIYGLKLAENSGRPLAGFDRLYVNFGLSGLLRFAWHIQDIRLDQPYAEFVVRRGGLLNWASLINNLNANKKTPSKTMPRILIDHIKINNGDIEYIDENRNTAPFKSKLQPLNIELTGLSTLPESNGQYKIVARLPEQGGTLMWNGNISLNPVKSDGTIEVRGVSLPKLLAVIKGPRNYELASGLLAARTDYHFSLVGDKPDLKINRANLLVRNFALAAKNSTMPVFRLNEMQMSDLRLDLMAQAASVSLIRCTGGNLSALRNIDGTLDWQALFAIPAESSRPVSPSNLPQAEPNVKPWTIAVKALKLNDWNARYTDKTYMRPVRIEASHFSLAASINAVTGASPALYVSALNAALGPLQLFSGDNAKPAAQLNKVKLGNAQFDQAANRLDIEAIELTGAATAVEIGKDKRLNWSRILAKAASAPAKKSPGAKHLAAARAATAFPAGAAAKAGSSKPLEWHLGRLTSDRMHVALSDFSTIRPVKLDIVDGHLGLSDISLRRDRPIPVDLGFNIKQGGSFSLSGTAMPDKSSTDIKLSLANLSLKPFAPYVNRFARLTLNSGTVSTSGRLKLAVNKNRDVLSYIGGFAIDRLAIQEEDTGDAFLVWRKLSTDRLTFTLGPNRLNIAELVASQPFAKVIIFKDKSLNLDRILRSYKPQIATSASSVPAVSEPEAVAPEAVALNTRVNKPKHLFPLSIERLRIVNGAAEYADLSLPTQFSTRMHALNGVVAGLSTNPHTIAQVQLDGQVGEYGSARIRGSIQPFHATDFSDLSLTFTNLEMATFTPYSGKFAGRKINSGRISAYLQYKIQQGQLEAENKFVINQLKLGGRVDSKEAPDLPLDLAIALLQNSNGVIDLDLPVTGNLNDPQFSYGKIIWKALVNVVTKLVTAPFRALGNLLGIDSEKMDTVDFNFGHAQLPPPEREKLKKLSLALAKRPALILTVTPGYQTQGDTRAIQALYMRREVAMKMGLPVSPGEDPGLIDTTNPDTQKALKKLYTQSFKKQGDIKALKAEFAQATNNPARIYDEMLDRLAAQVPVSASELQQLAQRRGAAIRQELVERDKFDEKRMVLAAPMRNDSDEKMAASKMNLGAAAAQ